MSLVLGLNIAWGFIALSAVLWFAFAERRYHRARLWQRVAAILMALCFLFPCVSASDDILGLSTLRSRHDRSPAPSKQVVHLDRVLQELENLQVSATFVFVFVLSCLGLVEIVRFRNVAFQRPVFIGRGPPSSF